VVNRNGISSQERSWNPYRCNVFPKAVTTSLLAKALEIDSRLLRSSNFFCFSTFIEGIRAGK
jgi:hypothetical protein